MRGPKFEQGDEPTEGSGESQNGLKLADFTVIRGPGMPMPLTVLCGCSYLPQLISKRLYTTMNWAGSNEADIQAAQPEAGQQAWIPRADENGGRPKDPQPPPPSRAGADYREDRREVVPETLGQDESLPQEARVRKGAEILVLLKRGKRKRTKNLDVFVAVSPVSRSRLGLIVPKHGHKIVERNVVKRRLREIGRRLTLPMLDRRKARVDVLIRARRPAYEADFSRLEREVLDSVEALCFPAS